MGHHANVPLISKSAVRENIAQKCQNMNFGLLINNSAEAMTMPIH